MIWKQHQGIGHLTFDRIRTAIRNSGMSAGYQSLIIQKYGGSLVKLRYQWRISKTHIYFQKFSR